MAIRLICVLAFGTVRSFTGCSSTRLRDPKPLTMRVRRARFYLWLFGRIHILSQVVAAFPKTENEKTKHTRTHSRFRAGARVWCLHKNTKYTCMHKVSERRPYCTLFCSCWLAFLFQTVSNTCKHVYLPIACCALVFLLWPPRCTLEHQQRCPRTAPASERPPRRTRTSESSSSRLSTSTRQKTTLRCACCLISPSR